MASAVTYEMVEQICNDLAATGENPTYLKVHEQLGKGATRIVSAHIKEWRQRHAHNLALNQDPIFGPWPEALQLKAKSLFDALLALSSEAAGASAEKLRELFDQQAQELRRAADDAHQERVGALDKLRSERAENARLTTELESLKTAEMAREAMIEDLLAQRELQVAQLAEGERRLEAIREEQRFQVIELGIQAASERSHLIDELRVERERAAGEREHLMRQTDQLRQDHAAAVQELKQRVANLEASLASQRRKTDDAETRATGLAAVKRELEAAVSQCSTTIAVLQAEVAKQKGLLLDGTARASSQDTRIAMLEQQLERENGRARTAEAQTQALILQLATPRPTPDSKKT